MRHGLVIGGCCALLATASGAVAQDDAPRTVTTRVRHVSTIVLPATETIVDVVAGDGEYWDVSASAHLAFIRPLIEGAESNLVILTAAGAVIPIIVVERRDAPVDGVIRVGPAAALVGSGPLLAPVAAVEAAERRAADAWEAVAAAEAGAAERVAAARSATQADLDAGREAYPRRLQFEYRWGLGGEPRDPPWLVEGMWHDGERTYLRTRAATPVLYEWIDGTLAPVTVATVVDGVVYVVARVLGPGELDVAGERLPWSVATRRTGP